MPKVYKKTVEARELYLYILGKKSLVKRTEVLAVLLQENKRKNTDSLMNTFYEWATTCSTYYCWEHCDRNTHYTEVFSVSDRYTVACWIAQKYLYLF